MRAPLLILCLIYLLNSLVILGAHAVVNIQLYKDANFTGLVWESSSNGGCTNIPKDKQAAIYSIRTNTCLIAYNWRNCKSFLTEKYLPGDIILSSSQLGRYRLIASLHNCNEEEGGNQLNLDITEHKGYSFSPAVLESYKKVCACVNVPQYVQNMSSWSTDNHHNDLWAYFEPDCSVNKWNPKFIPAGHNDDSRDMQDHQRIPSRSAKETYKIMSLGPDPNATYSQTSCNSGHFVATTSSTLTTESTTDMVTDLNAGGNCQGCRCQVLSNQIVQLKTQVDHLRETQEKFQREVLKQQTNYFTTISNTMAELKQQLSNFSIQI